MPSVIRKIRPTASLNTFGGSRGRHALVILVSVVVFVTVWAVAASLYKFPALFPGPKLVLDRGVEIWNSGALFSDIVDSLRRILIGFALGSLIGITLGLLAGSNRIILGLIDPFLAFFRFVPPLAWFAPALIWFGTGDSSKVVLIMYTSIFVVAVNTVGGVSAIPPNMLRMAGTFGISFRQRFVSILLPASTPYIIAGMRVAMGNAFMTVVTAEMLGASSGLGVLLNQALTLTDTRAVFVVIIILGFLGVAFDALFVFLMGRYGSRFRAVGSAQV